MRGGGDTWWAMALVSQARNEDKYQGSIGIRKEGPLSCQAVVGGFTGVSRESDIVVEEALQ